MIIRKFSVSTLGVLLLSACACTKQGGGGARNAAEIVRPLADDVVVMKYEGGTLTAKDLNDQVAPQVKRFAEETLEAYQQTARRALVQKLLEQQAKTEGLTAQQLIEKSAAPKEVSEKDIDAFFTSRPELKGGYMNPKTGKKEKVSREEVKKFLVSQSQQSGQQTFIEGLLAKANAKMVLELPRVKVGGDELSPFFGGKDAKVVIHEFSDFECPYCSRGKEIVGQIKSAYGDKVKIVFRHFPLPMHSNAKPASLAAVCAQEQGKFWEMHDLLFENQRELTAANFDKWATSLSLDMAKFKACQTNPASEKALNKDKEEADKVGVNSTPTFFVNGKRVAGALPFEEFRAMIDSELKGI